MTFEAVRLRLRAEVTTSNKNSAVDIATPSAKAVEVKHNIQEWGG